MRPLPDFRPFREGEAVCRSETRRDRTVSGVRVKAHTRAGTKARRGGTNYRTLPMVTSYEATSAAAPALLPLSAISYAPG